MEQIHENIQHNLQQIDIKTFLPIQLIARDVLAQAELNLIQNKKRDFWIHAPTGSGKTIACAVPIVNNLLQYQTRVLRCLYLVPSKELVRQVCKTLESICCNTSLTIKELNNCPIDNPSKAQSIYKHYEGSYTDFNIYNSADIVVSTPGFLVAQLLDSTSYQLNLDFLKYLVIDEADRLVDQDYDDWAKVLIDMLEKAHCFNNCTKICLSATTMSNPQKLSKLKLRNCHYIELPTDMNIDNSIKDSGGSKPISSKIAKYVLPKSLAFKHIIVNREVEKTRILLQLCRITNGAILIFVRSAEKLRSWGKHLRQGLADTNRVVVIEDRSLNIEALLEAAKNPESVLLCTDSLARGVEFPNLHTVIQSNFPDNIKTFVHRAGRTARADSDGVNITILKSSQKEAYISMTSELKIDDEQM